ncbi:MAG TPA: lysylphosphatidylglycerol synthase transmembrane domain-containing protein [Solirubrobacteraceae bacterium]|nr:lysylphosphatidylglycerol synthase transmembrane domain-containing protein [Solirubrobacteraceae bacterium]
MIAPPGPGAGSETPDPVAEALSAAEAAPLARDERRLLRRLVGAGLLAAVIVSLLAEVPPLQHLAHTITHMSTGWIALAVALELGSCAGFVVVFRLFFDAVPGPASRELAWTEMGSGALLPGGGVGAFAVGGWLLHRAGMSARQIVERSSGLFFLTSGVNVAVVAGAGLVLAFDGDQQLALDITAALAAVAVASAVLALPRLAGRRTRPRWLPDLLVGISSAQRALWRPHWRLLGAAGYLGFDIAVLWVTFAATGSRLPVAALVFSYMIGYLANLIPAPGGIGVLEGGVAGMLILYGASPTRAAAAVLVYHAIAFWIPSLGGLAAYARLRCRLSGARPSSPEPVSASATGSRRPRGEDLQESLCLAESCGWRRSLGLTRAQL